MKLYDNGLQRCCLCYYGYPNSAHMTCSVILNEPAMASSSDPWMKEYNESSRLADDISSMIADRGSLPQSGPEIMRHTSAIRRKITILGTRLDSLESLLGRIPPKSMYVLLQLLL